MELVQEKSVMREYTPSSRIWQGIPSVEVTPGRQLFVAFYSGGVKEEAGNYCLLYRLREDGECTLPVAVARTEADGRCFDPALWMDPLGRLWFTWAEWPTHVLWGAICEAPDAEDPRFGAPFPIGTGVMMNKPTALSGGRWLFPLAVWDPANWGDVWHIPAPDVPVGAYAVVTDDEGRTFRRAGCAVLEGRGFDEHIFLEHTDGRVSVYVRRMNGRTVGEAISADAGESFAVTESGIPCVDTRFHIRRLPSGRVLMCNHKDTDTRNNLAAFLSEDDGKTWKYSMMIDTRKNVSYPDVGIAEDGTIYMVYDRERGSFLRSEEECAACAREILLCRFTEEDIIAGKCVTPGSFLSRVISKLGKYEGKPLTF